MKHNSTHGVAGLDAQTKPPPDADAQAGDHGDADAGEQQTPTSGE